MAAKKRHHSGHSHPGVLLKDDMSAPCNLPQGVVESYYPSGHMYGMQSGKVKDLYEGVQKQMSQDHMDLQRAMSPHKY